MQIFKLNFIKIKDWNAFHFSVWIAVAAGDELYGRIGRRQLTLMSIRQQLSKLTWNKHQFLKQSQA